MSLVISKKYKYIFFHLPKNAGVSVSSYLIDQEIKLKLIKKITLRTQQMFNNRCINEVKKFNNLKVKKSLSANKLIGVQEINDFLKKSISLEQCKELIDIKTRQYAKRQNTWARGHMKNWVRLYSKNFSILLKKTLKVTS